jgi:tellurite resistance protein
MIPEESVAYAVAAWSRFEDRVPDELLRAVSGAFLLVAASDGELSRSEADRFLDVLRSKTDVFSALDFPELEKMFRDLSEALFADPSDGKRRALECVARARDLPEHAELVTSAAQIAADADGRLEAVEESVMGDIRRTLGVEPS